MQQLLEPGELLAVTEHDAPDALPVDLPRVVEHALAEALDDGGLDVWIVAEQVVNDLVARDHRRAVPLEGLQRLRSSPLRCRR